MTTAVAKREPAEIIEQVVAKGDLKELTPAQRTDYYKAVCESVGLNPLTRPLEYITLNGKLTLYARKDATDQLRRLHMVSVQIVSREQVGDVYAVTARATDARGRTDESIGAVAIASLKGDALCNALMKAETKAKRRVTLSICGLGMLDEAELETLPPPVRMPAPEPEPPVEVIDLTQEIADDLASLGIAAEIEPKPVRNVKLEGGQPTSPAAELVALNRKLGFEGPQLLKWLEKKFPGVTGADSAWSAINALKPEELSQAVDIFRERLEK